MLMLTNYSPYSLKNHVFIAWIQLSIIFEISKSQSDQYVQVNLADGSPLVGQKLEATNGKAVTQFLGVPFAEPPIGPLRFRKPVPKKPWKESLNATVYGDACLQLLEFYSYSYFYGGSEWQPNVPLSEDCLYMNIYVPGNVVDPRAKLPVMIWIYGGGFTAGTSSLDIYDGKILASEENVIVVNFNYRIGVLGFLYLGDERAPGNMGLWDQQLAMQWVQFNIEAFGGDPSLVTIFGESAGSGSVTMHMLAPQSQPYFARAIAESGSAMAPWAFLDKEVAFNNAMTFYDKQNCGRDLLINNQVNTDQILRCLMQLPAENFTEATFGSMAPVIDGQFFVEGVEEAVKREEFGRKPFLTGTNRDEGTEFMLVFEDIFPPTELFTRRDFIKDRGTWLRILHGTINGRDILNSPAAMQAIIDQYEPKKGNENEIRFEDWLDSLDDMIGDQMFKCAQRKFALAHSKVGAGDTYMYHFTHMNTPWPDWMGVAHAYEIDFVLGKPFNRVQTNQNYTDEEREFSSRVMRYWANFARTGDPSKNPNGSMFVPVWPKYREETERYMNLTLLSDYAQGALPIGVGLRKEQCKLWQEELPKLVGSGANGVKTEWKISLTFSLVSLLLVVIFVNHRR